ncbi:type II toxin-antitoxin system Phd/YefM family antitoxin [Arthrobacter sp. NA-172]
MRTVTVRELRNQGGEVLERVARGEMLIVTRDGHEWPTSHSRRSTHD